VIFHSRLAFYGELLSPCSVPNFEYTPCQLSATAYSIYRAITNDVIDSYQQIYVIAQIICNHTVLSCHVEECYYDANFEAFAAMMFHVEYLGGDV